MEKELPSTGSTGFRLEVVALIESGFASIGRRIDELENHVNEKFKRQEGKFRRLEKIAAPITPATGEVLILGTTWSKAQLTVVSVALVLAGLLVKWERAAINERIEDNRANVLQLKEFAGAGGRATAAELAQVADCVALRFRERSRGLAEGAALKDPDPTTAEQIEDCARRLKDLAEVLRTR